MSKNTNQITEEMLASLSEAQIEDLRISFAACNPLEFARHLHTLEIPDAIKSELLRAKVTQRPKEREETMQKIVESAMSKFWTRIGEAQV